MGGSELVVECSYHFTYARRPGNNFFLARNKLPLLLAFSDHLQVKIFVYIESRIHSKIMTLQLHH